MMEMFVVIALPKIEPIDMELYYSDSYDSCVKFIDMLHSDKVEYYRIEKRYYK